MDARIFDPNVALNRYDRHFDWSDLKHPSQLDKDDNSRSHQQRNLPKPAKD